MELSITILPESPSVYLINGVFFEGDRFTSDSEEVTFVTVLPLDATYLPYTVKLIGHRVATNCRLALTVGIGDGEFALKLGRRGFFGENHNVGSDDLCVRFFYLVKGGHFNFASELLSPSLRNGLSDSATQRFFAEFDDIVKVKGKYFLVGDNAEKVCAFSIREGKIDNIIID